MKTSEKYVCGDLSSETLNYFLVNGLKFATSYLLTKIHKRLHVVSVGQVVSNCCFYTENISSFLDYHFQPLAQRVESYIKGTNDFLNKTKKIGKLSEGMIPCIMDIVGCYPNIPHGECLACLRKFLETKDNKQILNNTPAGLADIFFLIGIHSMQD